MPATPESPLPRERLVFLHGFTQTHHHWHECADLIGRRLPGGAAIVLVDLPGHGLSGDDRLGITDAGATLTRLGGRGTYVGYSMGGRFALTAAAAGADEIERLVLIGATPGIADDHERSERRRLDAERAGRIETIGVDAFLDDWLAAPLFATLSAERHDLAHRRRNTVAGLAHSLRSAGTGDQPALWSRLGEIGVPVLVIAGELDTKFTDIGRRMAAGLAHGTFVSVAHAGHAAHTERPGDVAAAIAGWLERVAS
jgi:2-succinyl-6-hydroxy-2,4-cyclohexadiene-1-carboxylate synthase